MADSKKKCVCLKHCSWMRPGSKEGFVAEPGNEFTEAEIIKKTSPEVFAHFVATGAIRVEKSDEDTAEIPQPAAL